MGTQWHLIHHKNLLKVVTWQKCYKCVCKTKRQRTYTIRNSMDFYPPRRLSTRSIVAWQNPYWCKKLMKTKQWREKNLTCRLEATQDDHHNDPQHHLMFYYNKKLLIVHNNSTAMTTMMTPAFGCNKQLSSLRFVDI
jgi:hypothetical protein